MVIPVVVINFTPLIAVSYDLRGRPPPEEKAI